MSTKKDMMITSSNNSEHYIKNGVYYYIKKEEERFASLPTPIRAFIRRIVLERRYELLLEIVKLSREITSPAKTNQLYISKVCGTESIMVRTNSISLRSKQTVRSKRIGNHRINGFYCYSKLLN